MWLARDKEGKLYLYTMKPSVGENGFVCSTDSNGKWCSYIELDEKLYPEITWENSPKEVIQLITD